MDIIDLTRENEQTYFHCLQESSEEMKEATTAKEDWYVKMKSSGLRVKLARDEDGTITGMIQYFPIEQSWVQGKDLYFIGCIWVPSHIKGKGNYQNQGIGTALLNAAEKDVAQIGSKGIVAWGAALPVWMKASWYKKRGYKSIDRKGFLGDVLLWKKLAEDAQPPKWNKQKKFPEKDSEKVKITCLNHGWCPAMNLSVHRAKKVASEFGDNIIIEEVDTFDTSRFEEWGTTDSLYIDGKKISTGPPPTEEKLRSVIEKFVSKKKKT
ncbi:MAG: GNAT family N-acetyltransferase [Bacteroidales bacterium]